LAREISRFGGARVRRKVAEGVRVYLSVQRKKVRCAAKTVVKMRKGN